ncbi:MAG: 3-keto-5-aminohexanoate cleavage protein, partial [Acidimicrobiia bacterium]
MTAHPPTVIEAALNGMTTSDANPNVPRSVDEIVESGFACLAAGASIIHHHNDEPLFGGPTRHATEPYVAVWRRLRERHPRLVLHPTMAGATPTSTVEERFAHIVDLYDTGLEPVATCDAGILALAFPAGDGGPPMTRPDTFGNSAAEVDWILRWCREREVSVHISIFEPGMLRLVLAHHAAGTLPQAKIQLYLGGDRMLFGLPSTPRSLDAYLA